MSYYDDASKKNKNGYTITIHKSVKSWLMMGILFSISLCTAIICSNVWHKANFNPDFLVFWLGAISTLTTIGATIFFIVAVDEIWSDKNKEAPPPSNQ